ncbi:MAG: type II toxin-antitoxin system RelE/ParE family toxin [Thiomicrospira sp.]|uniref:type II toxin-antitoxin system RelE/ParE family toxin n=1 Tax=Thiomicrospira sp. TaxID=935 RepID=UPI0019F01353|nr:type II toxin-antitoxin system RelE/ParE family toxin [Thiomicrospira sp.]MBE0493739.1 type II toxin-antitoxin system RelE/ParE family toxin [Thiomicrospira sp.]
MNVLQTNRFQKAVKKLHANQKLELDNAIQQLIQNPEIGELKKGDLTAVRVFKFKMQNQLTLLGYRFINDEPCLLMLSVGSHENFYRDLKA